MNMKEFLRSIVMSKSDAKILATKYIDANIGIYGFRNPNNNLCVIFENNDDEKINERRSGIQVTKKWLDIEGVGKKIFIICECRGECYEQDFEHLISNIVNLLLQGFDVVSAIKFSINNWYHFLDKENKDLSFEEKIGIIGELYVLEKVLETKQLDLLKCWVGPLGGEKDFIFSDGFDFEVKSTCKETKHIHRISNTKQLVPLNNKLYLISLVFKKVDQLGDDVLDLNILLKRISFKLKDNLKLYMDFLERLKNINLNPNFEIDSPKLRLDDELIILIDDKNINNFVINNENNRILKLIYDFDFNGLDSKGWSDIYEEF